MNIVLSGNSAFSAAHFFVNSITGIYLNGRRNGGKVYDKLSEYPFNALLFNGWGFGVEYNEPRGHVYMMKDQAEIDPSRVKAGGSCLSCKTPYAPRLAEKHGLGYFSAPYKDAATNPTANRGRQRP